MMQCPNCQKLFVEERAEKFRCEDCGWFEKVDDEWRVCEAPAPPSSDERDSALSKVKPQDDASITEGPATGNGSSVERSAKNHSADLRPTFSSDGPQPPEPDGPQPPEPDGPQPPEPDGPQPPEPKVREILGGLVTITEVEE